MPESDIQFPQNSNLLHEKADLQTELLTWLLNYNSRHTRKAYLTAMNQFKDFIYLRARLSLLDVQQLHGVAWKEAMQHANYSQTSINLKLSAVSAFYTHLIEKNWLTDNPLDGVKRKSVDPYNKATYLTLEQQKRFLSQIDTDSLQGKRDYAMMLIFLTTGVRISAVTEAHVNDIVQNADDFHLLYNNKGGTADRAQITAIMPAIDDYLEARQARLDDPLFVATERGRKNTAHLSHRDEYELRPLHANTIRQLVKKYARHAGYENITPHSLRHSAAMTAATKGTVIEVSKLLRHKNMRVTTIYLNHLEAQEADEITKDLAGDLLD